MGNTLASSCVHKARTVRGGNRLECKTFWPWRSSSVTMLKKDEWLGLICLWCHKGEGGCGNVFMRRSPHEDIPLPLMTSQGISVTLYIRPNHLYFFSIVTKEDLRGRNVWHIIICFHCYVIAEQFPSPTNDVAMSITKLTTVGRVHVDWFPRGSQLCFTDSKFFDEQNTAVNKYSGRFDLSEALLSTAYTNNLATVWFLSSKNSPSCISCIGEVVLPENT